ncbi:hypothetical protein IQ260_09500, partial [Leptolyngbya cf. ectocarpi LEGE 11479]
MGDRDRINKKTAQTAKTKSTYSQIQASSRVKNVNNSTDHSTIGTSTNFHFGDISVIQPKRSVKQAYKKHGQETVRPVTSTTQILHTDASKVENPLNAQLAQLNHPIQTKALSAKNDAFLKQGVYSVGSNREQRANASTYGVQK